jgi:myo-inositol catabolism protein IolH
METAVKIAIDRYMFRSTPLTELPRLVADLDYEYIELSPREDLLPFFLHPRSDRHRVASFKAALDVADVKVSSVLPMYRWSGPDEVDMVRGINSDLVSFSYRAPHTSSW